jgi:hypothetical protein
MTDIEKLTARVELLEETKKRTLQITIVVEPEVLLEELITADFTEQFATDVRRVWAAFLTAKQYMEDADNIDDMVDKHLTVSQTGNNQISVILTSTYKNSEKFISALQLHKSICQEFLNRLKSKFAGAKLTKSKNMS